MMAHRVLLAPLVVALLGLGCCVYTFNPAGKSSIQKIAVDRFDNKTTEYDLADRMTDLVIDSLNVADIQIHTNRVVLHVSGKRRKHRLVTLTQEWVSLFRSCFRSWSDCRGDSSLFLCGQAGHETKRLTVAAIDYLVRRYAKGSGIHGISAHTLRHTAASLAIDAGEPLHRLRDGLGHSSVLVTSQYLHAR